MLLYKTVNERNHIIISYGNTAVVLNIFVADFALIIHNQFRRIAVAVHIMIIAHIVLRKHKRNFPRRKKDLPRRYRAVLADTGHIIYADHHVALVIHGLRNLVKFVYRCHNLIIIRRFVVSVKSLGRILN